MNKIDLIIDALQKAQDGWQCFDEYKKALAAARELKALKPVAWMMPDYGDVLSASEADGTGIYNIPLYTAPQKYCPSENTAAYEKGVVEGMAKQMHSSVDRAVNEMGKPWVGLTDDEIDAEMYARLESETFVKGVKWAEERLKEKNGG